MNDMFKDDRQFILELKKGNRKAFAFLFKTHYSGLVSYVFNLCKNKKQAEDIVQNIIFKFWNKKESFDEKKSLKGYLYRMAYNEFVDEMRRQNKRLQFHEELKHQITLSHIESDEEVKDRKRAAVLKAIDNLPDKCRETFMLHKQNGLKYKEIAEELGISVKTVENHISKALRRIREELGGLKI